MLKGANIARKRNVLGRGLSALMTSSAVAVEPDGGANVTSTKPNDGYWPTGLEVERTAFESNKTPENRAPRALSNSLVPFENLPAEDPEPQEGALVYLSLDRVIANPKQPRQYFEAEEISRLSKSIKESGLLQPILVRRVSGDIGQLGRYEIVAGERRWRAAQEAGLRTIPAVIRQINDREALELAIVENVQRADLNPIEEAVAYERLVSEFGATQGDVAKSVGKDRASIANSLRLLKLPQEIKTLLIGGKLTAGHARAVLVLEGESDQCCIAAKIVSDGLSVREAERFVVEYREALTKAPEEPKEKRAEKAVLTVKNKAAKGVAPKIEAVEERLRRVLGTKVRVSVGASGSGELRIAFYSEAELNSLLDRLGA